MCFCLRTFSNIRGLCWRLGFNVALMGLWPGKSTPRKWELSTESLEFSLGWLRGPFSISPKRGPVFFAASVLSCPLIAGKFSPIAEPDPDHLLLHVQAVRHKLDLLAGGLGVLVESALQGDPHRRLDGSSLLSAAAYGVGGVEAVAVDVGVAAQVAARVLRWHHLSQIICHSTFETWNPE